jgi:hypothetical protein
VCCVLCAVCCVRLCAAVCGGVLCGTVGGWPVKEEVRSKPRTCGEGRMKEEGRLLPMLEDVKKEDSCGRARESGRARRG